MKKMRETRPEDKNQSSGGRLLIDIEVLKDNKTPANKQNLFNALEVIFNDSVVGGFWDKQGKYISEKLVSVKNQWIRAESFSHRYGLFTLSMILLSKDLYNLDTVKYNKNIVEFIYWTYNNLDTLTISELTYGGLTSVILGKKLYKLNDLEIDVIEKSLLRSCNYIMPITDNHNSLILIAIKYFLDQKKKEEYLDRIRNLCYSLLQTRNKTFFETGDIRANYHQRIMYVLWGLLFASNYCYSFEIKKVVEEIIEFIWINRRDKKDNALLWHPTFYFIKNKNNIKVPVFSPKSAKYLFQCHQTFFANSINFYQKFYSSNLFQHEKESALEWIWGKNRLNLNLADVTGLGIPCRIMDTKGNLCVDKQQFIGSYEVGSLILALTSLYY